MSSDRVPLQAANFQSRLPGPRTSKLPGPTSTKLPTPASVKRTLDDDSNTRINKRRKLSNDKTPPAVSAAVRKAATQSSRVAASKPAPKTTKTTAKPAVSRAVTQPKPKAPAATKPAAKSSSTSSLQKAAAPAAPKKARPAWDLKGRLADMEEQMKSLSSKFKEQKELNEQGDVQIKTLSANNENLLTEHKGCKVTITNLQNSVAEKENELIHLNTTNSQLKRSLTSLEGDYSAAQTHITTLKCSVAEMSAAQEQIKSQLGVTKVNLEASQEYGRHKDRENDSLKTQLSESQQLVEQLQEKIRAFESERRVLHNTIQELKGNIRVFCRVRPLIGSERDVTETIEHISFQEDAKTLEVARLSDVAPNETLASARKGSKYEFKYDKVFTPESTQADVFEEISQLVQSALDGYNVCIFAYGQTGSGKTFTMEGAGNSNLELQGMIPRSVSLVFDFVNTLHDKGWKYDFEASFLEIYNETIRDLLGDDAKDNLKHEIKMVAANSNEVYVTNLTQVKVTEREQVHKLLKKAAENRAVAETRCNARSSRSHSVFRMRIEGHNSHTDEKSVGVLNLIDLAGSERIKESGSEGQRLKEATAINGSLSHLGNVIMALANKDGHVPYRNSKLTHLLQNCLGGSSKVLMFVNVSPREDCVAETLNSLRFATKVNNCHIGTAQKKVK